MRCDGNHHPSCAKLMSKIKLVDAGSVPCCGTSKGFDVGALISDERLKTFSDNPDTNRMYAINLLKARTE